MVDASYLILHFLRGILGAHPNEHGASTLLVPTLWQTWPAGRCSMRYNLAFMNFYGQPSTLVGAMSIDSPSDSTCMIRGQQPYDR